MKYKGIIFDLDGTLLNTIEDISDSMNAVLEEFGYNTHNYEEYKLKIGSGLKNLTINSLDNNVNEEEIEKIYNRLVEVYSKNYMNKSKEYNGIKEMLLELQNENIKIGIFSNKKEEYTLKIAESIFSYIDFTIVLGQVEDRNIKPDTEGIDIILNEMGLDKSDVAYVGDSNVDMITGKNSGLFTIGVSWGFRSVEELENAGADIIVNSPSEILRENSKK